MWAGAFLVPRFRLKSLQRVLIVWVNYAIPYQTHTSESRNASDILFKFVWPQQTTYVFGSDSCFCEAYLR